MDTTSLIKLLNVAALVAIDLATAGKWAERRNLAYTSFQDLSARPEVRALIAQEIRTCNATLPPGTRIRRFLLINKEFDADDNEITRTRKIRRRFVAEKYASRMRPVLRRIIDARPRARRRSHAGAVRRSCQTIAWPSGLPVRRSQTTVVSR